MDQVSSWKPTGGLKYVRGLAFARPRSLLMWSHTVLATTPHLAEQIAMDERSDPDLRLETDQCHLWSGS